ncbi:FtsK/SpoIIIE domain-containing protein [Smaragdicoccus niigatensis]|uniref:FtsK/SpoIIIE domain-containing protein n=1 Tax=Smaragdicoccus niigatensis TaxID=359359 RepID=UPI0003649FCA|nr:FtsK/SpoIIIE domain-containing protein [Smaragdicoccus niigatensis]
MHLKLTLKRPQGRSSDIGVTVDATALVSDLAAALYSADPARAGAAAPENLTLRVEDRSGRQAGALLDPTRNLIEAGVRSGSVVSLERFTGSQALDAGPGGPTAALVRVVGGPDEGRQFSLPVGVSTIGRTAQNQVRLTDPLVSKRHARIVVGESIEIIDENSVNGVLIGGRRVARATVGSADLVLVGDTYLTLTSTRMAGTAVPTSPVIEFNRSPRVVARFPERTFQTPDLPKHPHIQRFPWLSMLMPLVMGAAFFAISRSLVSVLFIALMPLMAIATYFEQRYEAKRNLKQQKANFETGMQALVEEVNAAQQLERAVRASQSPSVDDAMSAVDRLGTMLWTHRPEHNGFLTVRLGMGAAPSLCRFETQFDKDGLPEYRSRAVEFVKQKSIIEPVPQIGDFRTAGVIGVAGPRGRVEGVARGLVMQLVALHSPAELTLTVLASPMSKQTWEWVQWLPHVGSVHSPLRGAYLADNQGTGLALLAELEDLVAKRSEEHRQTEPRGEVPDLAGATVLAQHKPPTLPAVVVLIEDDTPVDRARLNRLAETGPEVGVHLLWVAAHEQALPAACRTFVLVSDTAGATVGQVRHGLHAYPTQCVSVQPEEALRAALQLSPVVDTGLVIEDSSDLPLGISWLDLVGIEMSEASSVVADRWRQGGSIIDRSGPPIPRRKDSDLRAVIGSAGATPLALDLREQGPHALVGGTTGSGKSEFLQTWVLAMAGAHSPDRVTFLFVDYKGGAAFADCIDLPHTVGLVTDLSTYLVRRALTSLRAEIHFRERLLQRKRKKDLISLERTGDPECPPSLVIVVDEFAALVKEIPEFVDGVVDVAQRGRSLGLHLVLATQRPAGVIKDNLRANTNLRIALRMADTDDSTDVIGVPDAANFPPNIPGRAVAKTGPGRLTTFQTGYVGGRTSRTPEAPPIQIDEMRFGAALAWEVPAALEDVHARKGPNDIARVVSTIKAAATESNIPEPRKPWLPELKNTYDYRDLITMSRTDDALLLGIGDEPEHQHQPIRFWEPNTHGNMVIFGASGSGKSAALRQVTIAAAASFRGGPVHCYGLDFSSAGLSLIADLPNVGAIIDGDDEERLSRLMRQLVATVDERATRYAAAQSSTITEYRARANAPTEPRIVVLVDGIGAFREAYEHSLASPWFTMFCQIAADGRAVGVHVVVTADRPAALPTSLGSSVQRRIVLRMASADDYMSLGVASDILNPNSPPGRGVLDGCEVQLSVLGGDANVAVQGREIAAFAAAMRRKGAMPAPEVASLPEFVALPDLPVLSQTGDTLLPSLGLRHDTLSAVGFHANGAFLVAGAPGSGRSTALHSLAHSIRRATPHRRLVLLAAKPTRLASRFAWTHVAEGPDAVDSLARELTESIEAGSAEPGSFAFIIENLPGLDGTLAESAVSNLVTRSIDNDHFVVGEGEYSTWTQAWNLAPAFKSSRRGLLLMPRDIEGDTLLQTSLGRLNNRDQVPGRGFVINRGKATKLQVAVAADEVGVVHSN